MPIWCGVPFVRVISSCSFERTWLYSLLNDSRDSYALKGLGFSPAVRAKKIKAALAADVVDIAEKVLLSTLTLTRFLRDLDLTGGYE